MSSTRLNATKGIDPLFPSTQGIRMHAPAIKIVHPILSRPPNERAPFISRTDPPPPESWRGTYIHPVNQSKTDTLYVYHLPEESHHYKRGPYNSMNLKSRPSSSKTSSTRPLSSRPNSSKPSTSRPHSSRTGTGRLHHPSPPSPDEYLIEDDYSINDSFERQLLHDEFESESSLNKAFTLRSDRRKPTEIVDGVRKERDKKYEPDYDWVHGMEFIRRKDLSLKIRKDSPPLQSRHQQLPSTSVRPRLSPSPRSRRSYSKGTGTYKYFDRTFGSAEPAYPSLSTRNDCTPQSSENWGHRQQQGDRSERSVSGLLDSTEVDRNLIFSAVQDDPVESLCDMEASLAGTTGMNVYPVTQVDDLSSAELLYMRHKLLMTMLQQYTNSIDSEEYEVHTGGGITGGVTDNNNRADEELSRNLLAAQVRRRIEVNTQGRSRSRCGTSDGQSERNSRLPDRPPDIKTSEVKSGKKSPSPQSHRSPLKGRKKVKKAAEGIFYPLGQKAAIPEGAAEEAAIGNLGPWEEWGFASSDAVHTHNATSSASADNTTQLVDTSSAASYREESEMKFGSPVVGMCVIHGNEQEQQHVGCERMVTSQQQHLRTLITSGSAQSDTDVNHLQDTMPIPEDELSRKTDITPEELARLLGEGSTETITTTQLEISSTTVETWHITEPTPIAISVSVSETCYVDSVQPSVLPMDPDTSPSHNAACSQSLNQQLHIATLPYEELTDLQLMGGLCHKVEAAQLNSTNIITAAPVDSTTTPPVDSTTTAPVDSTTTALVNSITTAPLESITAAPVDSITVEIDAGNVGEGRPWSLPTYESQAVECCEAETAPQIPSCLRNDEGQGRFLDGEKVGTPHDDHTHGYWGDESDVENRTRVRGTHDGRVHAAGMEGRHGREGLHRSEKKKQQRQLESSTGKTQRSTVGDVNYANQPIVIEPILEHRRRRYQQESCEKEEEGSDQEWRRYHYRLKAPLCTRSSAKSSTEVKGDIEGSSSRRRRRRRTPRGACDNGRHDNNIAAKGRHNNNIAPNIAPVNREHNSGAVTEQKKRKKKKKNNGRQGSQEDKKSSSPVADRAAALETIRYTNSSAAVASSFSPRVGFFDSIESGIESPPPCDIMLTDYESSARSPTRRLLTARPAGPSQSPGASHDRASYFDYESETSIDSFDRQQEIFILSAGADKPNDEQSYALLLQSSVTPSQLTSTVDGTGAEGRRGEGGRGGVVDGGADEVRGGGIELLMRVQQAAAGWALEYGPYASVSLAESSVVTASRTGAGGEERGQGSILGLQELRAGLELTSLEATAAVATTAIATTTATTTNTAGTAAADYVSEGSLVGILSGPHQIFAGGDMNGSIAESSLMTGDIGEGSVLVGGIFGEGSVVMGEYIRYETAENTSTVTYDGAMDLHFNRMLSSADLSSSANHNYNMHSIVPQEVRGTVAHTESRSPHRKQTQQNQLNDSLKPHRPQASKPSSVTAAPHTTVYHRKVRMGLSPDSPIMPYSREAPLTPKKFVIALGGHGDGEARSASPSSPPTQSRRASPSSSARITSHRSRSPTEGKSLSLRQAEAELLKPSYYLDDDTTGASTTQSMRDLVQLVDTPPALTTERVIKRGDSVHSGRRITIDQGCRSFVSAQEQYDLKKEKTMRAMHAEAAAEARQQENREVEAKAEEVELLRATVLLGDGGKELEGHSHREGAGSSRGRSRSSKSTTAHSGAAARANLSIRSTRTRSSKNSASTAAPAGSCGTGGTGGHRTRTEMLRSVMQQTREWVKKAKGFQLRSRLAAWFTGEGSFTLSGDEADENRIGHRAEDAAEPTDAQHDGVAAFDLHTEVQMIVVQFIAEATQRVTATKRRGAII